MPVLPPVELPIAARVLVHEGLRDRLVAFDGGQRVYYVADMGVVAGPVVPSPVFVSAIEGRGLVHDAARDELFVFGGRLEDTSQLPHWSYHPLAAAARER